MVPPLTPPSKQSYCSRSVHPTSAALTRSSTESCPGCVRLPTLEPSPITLVTPA